jgi:hypothetical protein
MAGAEGAGAPHRGAGPFPLAGPHLGRVTSFDPVRGLGEVGTDGASPPGGVRYGFHATAIADGSRQIRVGTRVAFTVAPGHRGRYEARSLVPLPPDAEPGGAASG